MKYAMLISTFVFAVTLLSCGGDGGIDYEDIDFDSAEYRVGYDEGSFDGYREGKRAGYDEGKRAGYDEGYKKGYEQGFDEGY